MFWRVVYGCLFVLFIIGWGYAIWGDWELGNRELTYWVMLSLAIGFGHEAFNKPSK